MKNKLKTSKSASKRFGQSSKGGLRRRPVKTGHFNAKSTGSERQRKRGLIAVSNVDMKEMKSLMPYLLKNN